MKFTSKILAAALVIATMIVATAQAQFNLFSAQRSIVVAPPQTFTPGTPTVTNGPVDIGGYLGEAYIDIVSFTNAGGALTATIETSNNSTNATQWSAFTNYALISSTTSYSYTNFSDPTWATNVYATNPYLLPGTITTPTAYSAGYATPYLAPLYWTNGGAITITKAGVYRVGFKAQDQKRYLHIIWTPTGASSNDVVTATFNGIRGGEVQ